MKTTHSASWKPRRRSSQDTARKAISDQTRRLLIAALALSLSTSQVFAQKELYLKREFTGSTGSVLPYRILSPAVMEPGAKYPVVLFLHGAGERGSDNEKQLKHGSTLFLEASNREKYPAIVIFPQCPQGSSWVNRSVIGPIKADGEADTGNENPASSPMQLVIEMMEEVLKMDQIDKDRIYVMGLSMGGFGLYDLLHRRPKWFAAAVPICGGGDVSKVDWYAKELPLWVFHGADDRVVSVEASRKMVSALEKAGGSIIYTEYPGVDHNSWDPAFAEDNLLQWMFEQKRAK